MAAARTIRLFARTHARTHPKQEKRIRDRDGADENKGKKKKMKYSKLNEWMKAYIRHTRGSKDLKNMSI